MIDCIPKRERAVRPFTTLSYAISATGQLLQHLRPVEFCQTAEQLKQKRPNWGAGVKGFGGRADGHLKAGQDVVGLSEGLQAPAKAGQPIDNDTPKASSLRVLQEPSTFGPFPQR